MDILLHYGLEINFDMKFLRKELGGYNKLLQRCISKGIVLTCETTPVNVRCNIKESVENIDSFKEIGKQLISEVRKIERNSDI